ncbi:hypothetical protein FBU59_001891 [Linderina macrospora]|uniref:Uncharacterized protein n=1 Tax=Linderina macrospora TaxID=4868 RepID=A0ACC1JCV3_9FUNG|nr:hypothetical protein FBU59_001891 [Linderina macrospora]
MGDHKERIHFGTLERDAVGYAKRKREEAQQEAQQGSTSHISRINLDMIDEVVDETEDASLRSESLESRRKAMQEFERKRIARTIAVPTEDEKVKLALRKHGHPICLFGEDAGDRRSRLRYILSKIVMEGGKADEQSDKEEGGTGSDDENEEFFTEGSQELLRARRDMAEFSLGRAQKRIEQQREEFKVPLVEVRQRRQELITKLKSYANMGSQVGDDRPLSRGIFSPDSKHFLTSSWTGHIKLWSIPDCQHIRTYRGHTDRVGGLSFHPRAGSLGEETADFSSGAADSTILLWSMGKETPVGKLEGHASRVVHVDHHPNGSYLGSASYDGSWRLWDIATQTELLLQEGHSRELFALKFQCDGSLVATGGLDGIGRVWDLRSGRSIMSLQGHAKEIFGIDWSPNGFQVATGSADNTVKIFDVRRIAQVHEIPAHRSMVTDVRFSRHGGGQYLATASNDGLVNVWTAGDWRLQKSLAGHSGKVMSVDISSDGSCMASTGYDCTLKLWME